MKITKTKLNQVKEAAVKDLASEIIHSISTAVNKDSDLLWRELLTDPKVFAKTYGVYISVGQRKFLNASFTSEIIAGLAEASLEILLASEDDLSEAVEKSTKLRSVQNAIGLARQALARAIKLGDDRRIVDLRFNIEKLKKRKVKLMKANESLTKEKALIALKEEYAEVAEGKVPRNVWADFGTPSKLKKAYKAVSGMDGIRAQGMHDRDDDGNKIYRLGLSPFGRMNKADIPKLQKVLNDLGGVVVPRLDFVLEVYNESLTKEKALIALKEEYSEVSYEREEIARLQKEIEEAIAAGDTVAVTGLRYSLEMARASLGILEAGNGNLKEPKSRELDHALKRISTMDEPALIRRMGKITNPQKMYVFALALDMEGYPELGRAAWKALKALGYTPTGRAVRGSSNESIDEAMLYLSDEGSYSTQAEVLAAVKKSRLPLKVRMGTINTSGGLRKNTIVTLKGSSATAHTYDSFVDLRSEVQGVMMMRMRRSPVITVEDRPYWASFRVIHSDEVPESVQERGESVYYDDEYTGPRWRYGLQYRPVGLSGAPAGKNVNEAMSEAGNIKPNVAGRIIQQGRTAKAHGAFEFGVFRVKKNGLPESRADARHRGFKTKEEADQQRAAVEKLNPGAAFVVLPVVRSDARYIYSESLTESIEGLAYDKLVAGAAEVKQKINAPLVSAQISTLGGKERAAMLITVALDPKSEWKNGILENSRYIILDLSHTGSLSLVTQGYGVSPKFRKVRVKDVGEAIKRINMWIAKVESMRESLEEYVIEDYVFDFPTESVKLAFMDAVYELNDEHGWDMTPSPATGRHAVAVDNIPKYHWREVAQLAKTFGWKPQSVLYRESQEYLTEAGKRLILHFPDELSMMAFTPSNAPGVWGDIPTKRIKSRFKIVIPSTPYDKAIRRAAKKFGAVVTVESVRPNESLTEATKSVVMVTFFDSPTRQRWEALFQTGEAPVGVDRAIDHGDFTFYPVDSRTLWLQGTPAILKKIKQWLPKPGGNSDVRSWIVQESLSEDYTDPAKETLDDVLDNILRKTIMLGSIDAIQDVDFAEDTHSVYLFLDATMTHEEIEQLREAIGTLYNDTQVVASPDGTWPQGAEPSEWWVMFVPQESHDGMMGLPHPEMWGQVEPIAIQPSYVPADAVADIAKGVNVDQAIDNLLASTKTNGANLSENKSAGTSR